MGVWLFNGRQINRIGECRLDSSGPEQGAGPVNTAMSLGVPYSGGSLFTSEGLSGF